MKKLSSLFFFCLMFFILQAQQQTILNPFDNAFKNVSRTEATTGILYERVIPMAQLYNFNSNLSPVDTSNYDHFLQSYYELYKATFIPVSNYFPFDIDSLKSLTKENAAVIDIGILHCKFNIMDSAVVYQKLYFGADSVLFENKSVSASLYVEKTALVVSPLKKSVEQGTTTFSFRDILKFDNTDNPIVELSADFDDGMGLREITNNVISVTYITSGTKTLRFDALCKNGDKLIAYSTIHCIDPIQRGNPVQSGWKNMEYFEGNNAIWAKIQPANPYDGGTFAKAKGEVWIYYANADKKLRKPVLIVDGFDPENDRTFESHKNGGKSIWKMLENGVTSNQNLGKQLLETYGYDLVVLDLPEGGIYIEQNAMVCIEVINMINKKLKESGSEHEIVVVGPSMGGQITRYALAYMEKNPNANTNNGNHNCRLWISFDSPHQGANISLGAQALMYKFGSDFGINEAKEKWDNLLCCKAAKQMLMHHKLNDGNPNGLHTTYYNKLKTLGYPQNMRKVAIANGSMSNSPNGTAEKMAFSAMIGIPPVVSIFAQLFYAPNAGNTKEVCKIQYVVLGIPIPTTWSWTNNTGKCSLDAAPGGYYDTFDKLKDSFWDVYTNEKNHCFMPIPSVLDISGNMNYCTNFSNTDYVATGKTPFQSYWGSTNTNMDHIEFTSSLVTWVFNEIETYISPSKRTIGLCDDTVSYSVHFPAGKTSPITWTCSSNLQIVSGQGSATIKVKALSAGAGWIEATLTGNNILTHNKTLKKYNIEVKFEGQPTTTAPTSVTSSATWNTPYLVEKDITISNNATLTLKNTNIYIAGGRKITVNTGAKLIIDGATLTNACDDLWQGIVIMSHPTQPMNTTKQGCVEVINNGKIENAVCAIEVKGGGIVKTNYANFSNNKIGINFLPLSLGQNSTSISLLNTNFSYTQFTGFEQHIKMNGCGNVILTHCKLTGNNNKGVEIKNVSVVNWGGNILDHATVSILAGGTLTLTDTMYFAGDATINVHPQSKLIVNGGILDKYHTEELQWQGITVMGNQNQPISQNYQGYAEFKNGAKIVNAVTGITVQGGGMVNVNNTQFVNNKTGVKFEAINPMYSGTSGTFTNATFEINSNYFSNLTDFYAHLNMQSCANVNVSGCTFSVPQTIFNKNSILINNTKSNWTNNNNLQSAKIYLLSGADLTNTGTINCNGSARISVGSEATFIHKGNIYSSNNSDITVHSGGELIVDGGKLTNLNSGTFWQGITVYGLTSTTPETKNTDERGYIEMKNGAKIENAICGITLKSGGVVNTNNAQFVNNKTGVKFEPCNIQNLTSGTFSYTTFKVDDNFISGTQGGHNDRGVNSHLIMDNCSMVSVSGCNFSNTSSQNILSDGITVKNTITNWSNNNTIRDVPLTLTDGSILTLTGKISNKDIDNDGIKVFSLSKLILDGGILTNTSLSISLPDTLSLQDTPYSRALTEEMWKGVAIYGGSTPNDEAMIELLNGGTIEHALCGIMVNDYGTVTANNAHFLNNTVSIKFNPLQNSSTFTSGTFNNTNFELNNDYIEDDPFDTHIFTENSGSVNINNSVFSSSAIKKEPKTNKGIVAQNSNLILGDIAGTNVQFSGFNTAIYATNTGGRPIFMVSNGIFENNLKGIEISSINNIEIVNNEFYLSDNESIGVTIANSTGYKIEENYFKTETNLVGTGNTTIGLHISDSGTEPNEVSLNTFDGVSIGQLFSGINADKETGRGLQSLCNTFIGRTGRIHDIYIGRYPNNNQGDIHLIAEEQGNNSMPAGNTFRATNPSIINISNNSYPIPNINYYHGRNSSELPTYNILIPILAEREALCESRYDEVRGEGYEVSGNEAESRKQKAESDNENVMNQSKSAQSVSSEFYLNDITLIPNPTTGKFRIENGELRIENVEVFDVYGRNLTPHTTYLAPHTSLDITNLSSGVYFVKIYTNAGVVVKKVVKQ